MNFKANCNIPPNQPPGPLKICQPLTTTNINQNISVLPPNFIKTSLFISSLNISPEMKENLIDNVLKSTNFKINTRDVNYLLKNTKKANSKNSIKNTRILFTKEEDDMIKKLVEQFGTHHWNLIANCMERRTAKQCRDRYLNYLIPGCFQGEWSKEEDSLLLKLFNEIGPKWSVIQKYFPKRGPNNIKNRWNYFISKQCNVEIKNNEIKTK